MTRLYRPSGDEEAVRRFIEDLVSQVRDRWPKGSVTTTRDPAGNLLVRLPGTGRFCGLAKPLVLQAHMDMVFAVDGAKPGEDLRPYFRNGVQTEVVTIDGMAWIRAKDGKTTLGADDGAGISLALRYLLDPSIEHPPLELVFTTREEVGMLGARQMTLPLAGRVLLNLDATREHAVTRGCMGFAVGHVTGNAAFAPTDAQARQVHLEIGGLKGGHSGRDAHRNRLNAIVAGAEVVAVAARYGGRLIAAKAGDGVTFNKITDACSIDLTVPASQLDAALRDMQAKFAELVAKRDEDPKSAKLSATVGAVEASQALTLDATLRFGSGIAAVPNGLLATDPSYPDGVKASSNLAYLRVDARDGSVGAIYSMRAFSDDDAKTWIGRIDAGMREGFAVSSITRDDAPPWIIGEDHWLVRTALDLGKEHFATSILITGAIECGPLTALYAGMAAISIGAQVRDNHTTRERMRRDSLPEAAVSTQALIEKLGEKMLRESARATLT